MANPEQNQDGQDKAALPHGVYTRVDFLRHGLPDGHGCLRGHTDFVITETGMMQMEQAVLGLDDIETVISSPLQRCSHFAQSFAEKCRQPLSLNPQWMEMNFGDWDGQSHQSLWDKHGSTLAKYWENPWLGNPHGGESLEAFDTRIAEAWQCLLSEQLGKRLLVVTHAGVMKQLLRLLLELPQNANYLHRIELPYAARYRVTVFTDQQGQHWPQIQWPIQQQF